MEEAKKILAESGLKILVADGFNEAARLSVESASKASLWYHTAFKMQTIFFKTLTLDPGGLCEMNQGAFLYMMYGDI